MMTPNTDPFDHDGKRKLPASSRPRASWINAQLFRHALQIGVLLFITYTALGTLWRNYKLAHNSRRIVGLFHGDFWAWAYGANDDVLSFLGDSYEASLDFLGIPWASTFFGIESVDPILALANVVQSHRVYPALFVGILLPLGLALVFGKVFCSHLCPMRTLFELGQALRKGLHRMGLPLPAFRPRGRYGAYVLLGGLLATALTNGVVWLIILPYVSLAAGIFLSITTGAFSGILLVAAFWWFIDFSMAPGLYCHTLCPTAFLLELPTRLARFRLRANPDIACPPACKACIRACPYALSPRELTHIPACNNCGICVHSCPEGRLYRGFTALPGSASGQGAGEPPPQHIAARHGSFSKALMGLLCLLPLLGSGRLSAHHNKGLPHYGYFENYPQVPTEEYVALHGNWEIGATVFNFQGLERQDADTPNDVKIYLYLYNLEADQNYKGPAHFEIRQNGELIATFDRESVDEESVYSTRETLPRSGTYEILAFIDQGRKPVATLPFYIDLAGDGVSPLTILAIVLPVLVVFGLALHGRKRSQKFAPKSRAFGIALTMASLSALTHQAVADTSPDEGSVTHQAVAEAVRNAPVEKARNKAEFSGDADARTTPAHAGHQMDRTGPRIHDEKGQGGGKSTADATPCPVCGMIGCTMQHYKTTEGAQIMVMGGIPLWLFLAGIAAILIVSFIGVEKWEPTGTSTFRLNLIKKKRVYNVVRSRWFQAIPQMLMIAIFAFLIYAGLYGSRVTNITPIVVWTIWWAGLIFAVALMGPLFCFMCPWDGLANLMSRLKAVARVKPITLGLTVPSWLKNLYPSIALFVLLTWLELGYGITTNPRATALMGLGMAAMAVIAALLWNERVFCNYVCPVGRISGMYANFSPVEIRARNPNVCARCKTEDCLHGNERGYPCPTGISLKTTTNSTYCTMCTECIKSCDKRNVAINIRPFAVNLGPQRTTRMDEAWLALFLLALTLFHGLTMTPLWENFAPGGWSFMKWMEVRLGVGRVSAFTLGMGGALALPILLYTLSCVLAHRLTRSEGVSVRELFVRYAWSLLPVALFYHLAHNSMHLAMEGGELISIISDPLGRGADYFGTRNLHLGSMLGEHTLWYTQVSLILVGHIFGIFSAHRISRGLYADKKMATRSLIPMLGVMILLSIAGLGLMHVDMNMRMGRM